MTDYLERLLEEQWEREDEREANWQLSPVRVARDRADSWPEPGAETDAAVENAAGRTIDRARALEAEETEAVQQTAQQAVQLADTQEEGTEYREALTAADRLSVRLGWQEGRRYTSVLPGTEEMAQKHTEMEPAAFGDGHALFRELEYKRAEERSDGDGLELPVGGGAAWADQAVRASLAVLPGWEPSSGVSTVERTADRPGWERLEAERLDRLFRRDARRYDGGYQLL